MTPRAGAILAVLWALSIAGCALPVVTRVDRNTRFDGTSRDAMVVFGFSTRLNVWLYSGIDDGVSWRCAGGRARARRVRPEEGFIVARLPATTGKEKYGIGAVGADMNIEVQGPKANQAVWVFNAEPGKVTYLGAYRVAWTDGYPMIVEDSSVQQSDADDYLTRTFANITLHVVPGRMESAYMSFDRPNGCR